jgi:hypothetical protein
MVVSEKRKEYLRAYQEANKEKLINELNEKKFRQKTIKK